MAANNHPDRRKNIREIETEDERREVFPVLAELRSHLDWKQFDVLYGEMAEEGYQLFAIYEDGEPVAVAGVTISTNFYLGRHAYVYDLVTTADHQSKGHGKQLLDYVHDWAANQDCQAVELESGLWREDAHRFYVETMGYKNTAIHSNMISSKIERCRVTDRCGLSNSQLQLERTPCVANQNRLENKLGGIQW